MVFATRLVPRLPLAALALALWGCADGSPADDAGTGPDAAVADAAPIDNGAGDAGDDDGGTGCEVGCVLDCDGDGVPGRASIQREPAVPSACVPGAAWRPGDASEATDCDDENASVFPGQVMYFETPRGDESFDYDCNGTNDLQFPATEPCTCPGDDAPPPDRLTAISAMGMVTPAPCGARGALLFRVSLQPEICAGVAAGERCMPEGPTEVLTGQTQLCR